MRFSDICRQGIQSLFRHRGRTMLTVLGVVVGCCAVVIMLSIVIGMQRSTEATLAQMGDLNMITVESLDSTGNSRLDDSLVNAIREIDHVDIVIPKIKYNAGVKLYAGQGERYTANYIYVLGEDLNLASMEGYELTEGDWESLDNDEVLVGEFLAYSFTDTLRPEGHNLIDRYNYYDWETDEYVDLPESYVNVWKDPVTLVLTDAVETPADTQNADVVPAEVHTITKDLTIGGVLKEDWNRGFETSEGIVMDLKTLEKLLDDYARLTGEKRQSDLGYSDITVKVDHIANVEDVETEIRRFGVRTSSMESIRKPMEQDVRQKQMLLGCVGAVSLFVAALGIANTMIMAITERTREIGVMKALGCFLGDIRKMFLLEAAYIGLIGGLIGIGISYLISWVMNSAGTGTLFSSGYESLEDGAAMDISIIPWWLALVAVGFSIFVGVAAGFYPAEKAVRISALDAIRRE